MKQQLLRQALDRVAKAHDETNSILAKGSEITDETIHAVRVSTKRLRAFWILLEPVAGPDLTKQAAKDLRAAASAFGNARDHHVMIQLLEKLIDKAKNEKKLDALTAVRISLGAHLPADESEQLGVDELRRIWDQDRLRWAGLSAVAQNDRDAERLIRNGFKKLYKKSRKLYRRAVARRKMNDWHSLRKWIKYLSLTLPICGNDAVLVEMIAEYVRLGKRLGKLHDFDELIIRIRQLSTSQVDRKQAATVVKLLSHKRDSLQVECDLDSRRLLESRPGAFVNRLLQRAD